MLSRTRAYLRRMRTAPLLALTLVLTAALVGCGDDREPAAARTGPTPAPSLPAAQAPSPSSPAPAALSVRLTGDGVDTGERLVAFGDPVETVLPALTAALGRPTLDTGEQPSSGTYGTCPGSRLRALEFGAGALRVLLGDAIGPGTTMYSWTLTGQGRPASVPKASALVGDVTTYEFAVGDTLGALRAGTSGSALEVFPGDEMLPPSFRLADQSSGFFGGLTGTSDDARITSVLAGEACGE